MTNLNDEFEHPQARNKVSYGVLQVFVNSIQFTKGASYTIPGVVGNDGKPFEFRGKQLSDNGRVTHVVMVLTKETKEGATYQVIKDTLTSDPKSGDPFNNIVRPSLIKVFGEHYGSIRGQLIPVEVEEVPYGQPYDSVNTQTGATEQRTKKMFRVMQKFDSYEAMRAAEKAHFAQFASANGDVDPNALPDGEVMQMLSDLFSKNDEATFRNLVTGADEIKGYNLDTIVKKLQEEKASF